MILMPYEKPQDNKPQESKYNSGLLQIGRLDDIWSNCKRYSVEEEYYKWAFELEAAWRELFNDAISLNKNNTLKNIMFNKAIDSCFGLKPDEIKGIQSIGINKKLLRRVLTMKEEFLRQIEQGSGKGSSYKDDSYNEFD